MVYNYDLNLRFSKSGCTPRASVSFLLWEEESRILPSPVFGTLRGFWLFLVEDYNDIVFVCVVSHMFLHVASRFLIGTSQLAV